MTAHICQMEQCTRELLGKHLHVSSGAQPTRPAACSTRRGSPRSTFPQGALAPLPCYWAPHKSFSEWGSEHQLLKRKYFDFITFWSHSLQSCSKVCYHLPNHALLIYAQKQIYGENLSALSSVGVHHNDQHLPDFVLIFRAHVCEIVPVLKERSASSLLFLMHLFNLVLRSTLTRH